MTRPTYGGAGGDFGFAVVNDYLRTSGGNAPAWDAEAGGSRITDLETLQGDPIDVVLIPGDGSAVLVKLPDGYVGEAWVGPAAGPRVRLTPPVAPPASTSARGLAKAATDAEVTAGTDPLSFVAPATLATRLASFRTTLLGGAQAAWDTLQELKDLEDTNVGTLLAAIGQKISATDRGAAGGVAGLTSSSKIYEANVPDRLADASLTAAYVAGRVYNSDGSASTTKKMRFTLDQFGEVDDIASEAI